MISESLQQQNQQLITEKLALLDVVKNKEAALESKTEEISQLKQQYYELMQFYRQQKFGASSEQLNPYQENLFDEVEQQAHTVDDVEDNNIEVKGYTKNRKGRAKLPDHLPREDIIHDLPESEKICPADGTALKHIADEVSEQLDIIPAQIKVLRHIRKKYACPCCQSHLATASKPKQPIEKSMASPGLLAYLITNKYVDGLPLYRQERILGRLGIELGRQTMATWMIKSAELLQPLINLIQERILMSSFIHMDETTVQVLKEADYQALKKRYMWVMRACPPDGNGYVFFHYDSSRSAEVVKMLLTDYTGAVMVDGYAAYNYIDHLDMTRLGCWAHARRKFVDAQRQQPKGKTGKADQALALIQKLYRIEKSVAALPTSQQRYDYRQLHAQPIIDKIAQWKDKALLQMMKQSPMGKALQYLHGQWDYLIRYLNDGDYPIDNNPAENAIRPFVIGRKNWLFSDTVNGAKASANFYSLIETVKAHDIEPYEYLRWVLQRIPNAYTGDDFENLMPDAFQKLKKIESNENGVNHAVN